MAQQHPPAREDKVFMPSHPLEPGARYGVLSGFDPGTRILRTGFRLAPQFRELPVDIVLDKDVAVTMRDGVTIYVDILRPVGSENGTEKVPVIVAWSPYGKGEGSAPAAMGVFGLVGLDNKIVSGLHKFEGPDPAYWCAQGYAICNPDARGVSDSEGDSVLWDRQEGQDCHDLIEWLAVQEWCTGKVAMSGTSYLAVAQWFAAAEQPQHLTAINPWEGVSDVYRDLVMRGGIPDTGFARQLRDNSYWGMNRKEDILAEAERYPLVNDLWRNKIPRVDRITVPAYVVASYSNTLHTAGTFRAWRRIGSKDKWLRIHNSQEWPDYYDEANREDLRRFFDHFLKGDDNGWELTPRVRYAILDLRGGDRVNLPADRFPPAGVAYAKYYLDAASRTLRTRPPVQEATVAYDAEAANQAEPNFASFLVGFDEQTTMVGYPKARLWVEADGADDMDLFVFVQKLDEHGTPLQQFTVPNRGARIHDVTERGASILRYKGSEGRLRVSMRHLDEELSTDEVPAHSFDRVEKLSPGTAVEIDIDLLPIGLVFHPGEQLRLVVSAQNLFGPWMPGLREYTPRNSGRHLVHTGGSHASYLQLPVQTVG
ncbi:CocE/NonD family hydrolase [Mycobacterium sp. Aquia_216]|uniref:CocE/NonD family hydrolase n=1 Tax=Mycobacterium sp. Aquia_216 TaxID=2991729 RepID=UPI00227BDC56|nr:CocE/NonD family hydrolase [Mycobacterium sp. Aquia_216]WAJ46344.1 CocE/NonD family hydrolase [Mycobacterium sp. Aquia_216]